MTDTARHFILRTDRQRQAAAEFILNLPPEPLQEVVVRLHEKTRTLPQNARYWASLGEHMKQIAAMVDGLAQRTGYSPLAVRRIIAGDIEEPERAAMLFVLKPEAAHEILKMIVGIPTSTRLGTKKFTEFHERMEQAMAEIVGEVNAFVRVKAA